MLEYQISTFGGMYHSVLKILATLTSKKDNLDLQFFDKKQNIWCPLAHMYMEV
jgi:hypothetical protein